MDFCTWRWELEIRSEHLHADPQRGTDSESVIGGALAMSLDSGEGVQIKSGSGCTRTVDMAITVPCADFMVAMERECE